MSEHSDKTPSAPAGWYADPLGRHERRYWDGAAWTDHIVDGTTQGTDPVSGLPVAMGQAAQVQSSIPAAADPTMARPGRSANRVAGCVVAAAGGVAMIAGTFMTWVSAAGFGSKATGWDFYRVRSEVHQNVFVTAGSMFTKSSPFLTGLATLIIGSALVVLALLTMALPASRSAAGQVGKREIDSGLAAVIVALAACMLVGGVWNLVTWFTTGPHGGVSAGEGLYLVAAGGIAGLMGLLRAIARRMAV